MMLRGMPSPAAAGVGMCCRDKHVYGLAPESMPPVVTPTVVRSEAR